MRTEYFFTQVILALVIFIVALEMIHFARRSIKELTKFILAIKFGDVSVNFKSDRLGKDFAALAESFRTVIEAFEKVKIEKEAQYHLLQAIIDKISFGIIAYNEDDEILLINTSAIRLLKIEKTKDWNYIRKHKAEFTDQIRDMVNDGRKLIELGSGKYIQQFSVHNHTIKLLDKNSRVVTFYDIQAEIEQKEIEAWYKLIRILTHEIMNSATPLASLTDTILMLLEDQKGQQKNLKDITEENIKDVRYSVNTIKKRSEGILQFVDAYRTLTDIPHPELSSVNLKVLFSSVISLLDPDFKKRNIRFSTNIVPNDLQLNCDKNLMEQVLINLLTNSMYALEDCKQPFIDLSGSVEQTRIVIQVVDNGKGMDKEVMRKIFIPFYSTREGGSGIGLSFSKFIILQHGGRIKVESMKNDGAKFIIDLPKK